MDNIKKTIEAYSSMYEKKEKVDEVSPGLAQKAFDSRAKKFKASGEKDQKQLKKLTRSGKKAGLTTIGMASKYQDATEEKEVNELSKGTLGSYIKKAGQSHANLITKASNKDATAKSGSDDEKSNQKRWQKADKRGQGLNRAIDKLVKKEGALDELSKKTMGSYVKKAIGHDDYDERPTLGNIKQASSMSDKDRKHSMLGTQHFSDPKTGKSKLTNKMLQKMKQKRKQGIATAVKKLQK